jgi:hypothetical protein
MTRVYTILRGPAVSGHAQKMAGAGNLTTLVTCLSMIPSSDEEPPSGFEGRV